MSCVVVPCVSPARTAVAHVSLSHQILHLKHRCVENPGVLTPQHRAETQCLALTLSSCNRADSEVSHAFSCARLNILYRAREDYSGGAAGGGGVFVMLGIVPARTGQRAGKTGQQRTRGTLGRSGCAFVRGTVFGRGARVPHASR